MNPTDAPGASAGEAPREGEAGPGLAVTGIGWRIAQQGERIDAVPLLRERKSSKYLGVQDALAVVVTGQALAQANWLAQARTAGLGERTGLYLAVGHIAFTERDIEPVLAASLDSHGAFSMERFAAGGYQRAHPLLAFRCLPNMPAYHIAANFDVQGPYYVAYPSAGQLYVALQQAQLALADGSIDKAIICGVAHQSNFLVRHHHARLDPPTAADQLRDAAAAIVLERPADIRARGATAVAWLRQLSTAYRPFEALTQTPAAAERWEIDGCPHEPEVVRELGPAAPLIALAETMVRGGRELRHWLSARDGIVGESHFAIDAPADVAAEQAGLEQADPERATAAPPTGARGRSA